MIPEKMLLFLYLFLLPFIWTCEKSPTESEAAIPLEWQGILDKAPESPQLNWVYFDTYEASTLIFNGSSWDKMSVSGLDAANIHWLGTGTTAPLMPQMFDTYYNPAKRVTYIFNGTEWDTLSCSENSGLGLQWKGTLTSAPDNPDIHWAYTDIGTGNSYIFNGLEWEILSMKGFDGLGIIWQGDLPQEPVNPQKSWAYYNTHTQITYLYSGTKWETVSQNGPDGDDATIIYWKGALAVHPEYPSENWAYFSTFDGNCYIYQNNYWQIFAVAGKDGIGIVWLGEQEKAPALPSLNWAYYNTIDKCSYIFNGSSWDLLVKDGKNGSDGIALIWKGELELSPKNPQENWVYYSTTTKSCYIYHGNSWYAFNKDGIDGEKGKDGKDGKNGKNDNHLCNSVQQWLEPGDSLILEHDIFNFTPSYIATYAHPADNRVLPISVIDSSWGSFVDGGKPQILLKKLDTYKACLINHTDKTLYMSLTIYLINSYSSPAITGETNE